MYSVSAAYAAAIRSGVRTDRLRGELRLADGAVLTFDDADLMSGSVTLDDACVGGQELQYGCAYLGQAALQLKTEVSRYRLYGAKISLRYGLQLPDGSWEEVPLGVYTVAEAERSSVYVAITAYDNLLALDAKLGSAVLRGDAYTIYAAIAADCGLETAQTQADIAALCNAEGDYQLSGADGCTTYRDALGALAQVLGCFGAVDAWGRLCLRGFAETPCLRLGPGERQSAAVADYSCHYALLDVETAEGHFVAAEKDGSGLSLSMSDAPLFETGLDTTRQRMAEALFAVLNHSDYTPATVQVPGDAALCCGDRIVLTGTGDGGTDTVEMLVMSRVWRFRGGMTLKAVGLNPYLAGAKTRDATAIRRLQSETGANKLIFYSYTNPAALCVANAVAETTAATLHFVATADTSAIFLAQLLVTTEPNTAAGTVRLRVRYYLNNLPIEDFEPQQVLVEGPHTLTLFYPFASVAAATSNRFAVALLAEGGKVRVAAGGLRATVTGQGMASGKTWDGTLNLMESVAPMTVEPAAVAAAALTQTMALRMQEPTRGGLAETIERLAVETETVGVENLTERLTNAVVVKSWTLSLHGTAYDGRFVAGKDGYVLRTEWSYPGEEQAVDTGRLTVVQTETSALEAVEGIVVK